MSMRRHQQGRRWPIAGAGLIAGLWAGLSATSMAGTVELSAGPPAATITVAPNLVVTLDDSGSMNWHHMPDQRPYDGNYWVSSSTDQGQGAVQNRTFSSNGAPFLCAGVITPGITDPTDPRSWSMNGVYYNPDNKYEPPKLADGRSMPNASFTAAWDNGIQVNRPKNPIKVVTSGNNQNVRDLGSYSFCGNSGAGYYKYTRSASTLPVDNATGRFTATAISNLYADDRGDWQWVKITSDAEKQNFANWYAYYRTRTMAAVSAMSLAFASLSDNVRVAWQNINSNELSRNTRIYKFVDGTATNNVRTAFYDWLFATPASGGTPNRSAAKRAGEYFTGRSGSDDTNPYWDRDVNKELICRKNFHIQMTDGLWNNDSGISAPGTTDTASSTLPDGRSFSVSDPESKVVWNEKGNSVVTMADIAFHYWANDLQASLEGSDSLFGKEASRRKVPVNVVDQSTSLFGKPLAKDDDPLSNKEIYWNPANDVASWPHLVQYMIGFGASGTLLNNDATYTKLRKGDVAWPVPAVDTDDGRKIDDMWHAALNSRGKYFAASSPSLLVDALNKIISSILLQSTTPMAGGLNSAVLTSNSVTYQAGFEPQSWSGTLKAFAIGSNGAISPSSLWDGRKLLDDRAAAGDSRVILTSTGVGTGKGTAFTWDKAGAALTAVDAAFDADGTGPDRLAWLRGNQSKDGRTFRLRRSVFGAVVNAQTLYVAAPTGGYLDNWPDGSPEASGAKDGKSYERFRADHLKRAPTLYVAANDGMLHAFDATTPSTPSDSVDITPNPGRERWAYVPYSAYGRLRGWSSLTDFSFMPSVDGTPVSRDVYFSEGDRVGWHTILVAGLRLGGRGVYALDVTEAASSEGATSGKTLGPAERVLWEFNHTSTGGANLGYTFGRPNIGRLANGKWVVLVPGGYFPEGSTEAAAKNTFSSLFVLDARTGELIREIQTPTTVSGIGTVESYGLSTPVLGDYDNNQIEDVAFAGDLLGNVWRFDLSSSSPSLWTAELFFRPKTPGDRPVTVMPRLFPTPGAAGFTVVFGTGKYLGGKDNKVDDNTRMQAVYGIRDGGRAGQAVVVDGDAATPLVRQTLVERDGIRGLTTLPVPANDGDGNAIRGWFFNLDIAVAKGERVVVDATALFDSGRAIITTLIPQANDPCDPAPRGALMVIDAATGAAAQGVDFGNVAGWPVGYSQAGARVTNPPTGGFLPATVTMGGGQVFVPGVSLEKDPKKTFSFGDTVWRRRSWRALIHGN
jgi:type IV pilus assembly protein PilY1